MANVEMRIDSVRTSLIAKGESTSCLDDCSKVVLLKEKAGERYLPIWISSAEAAAIAVKIQGIESPRPLFPDFTCVTIDSLGASIQLVIINKVENDCFYAKVILQSDKGQKEIDCRPGDALAVAIRRDVPIFADEKALEKAGIVLQDEGK